MKQWCIMSRKFQFGLAVTFLVLTVAWPLLASAAESVDGDFSLDIKVNGEDLSEHNAITVNPDGELTIELYFFDVTRDVTLEKVSSVIIFAGLEVATFSENLGGFQILPGQEHREVISISAKEVLKRDNQVILTGVYNAEVKLEYLVADQLKTWNKSQNIRIPGNPLSTLAGVVGLVITGVTAAAAILLARALTSARVAAGAVLPGKVSVSATSILHDFLSDRLEPTARGRVMANIVKTAKSRIVKKKCPLCGSRLRHGYCSTCQKSIKELQNEYLEKVKALALDGAKLLSAGKTLTLEALCSGLGIDTRLGTDILVTLKKSKLVKVKGIARKLMGKSLTVGIGSGLSAILWITLGGFAALSNQVLITILALSVVIPIVVIKGLQAKSKLELKRVS